jgi:ABC transporter substrate binding protein
VARRFRALGDAYPWLEIKCSRCLTPRDVDLCILRHVPTTCIHDLVGAARVSEVREGRQASGCHATPANTAPDVTFAAHRARIAELAANARLPTIYFNRESVVDGGLVSYGPNAVENYRRAAVFVDKILKGAKPGELPVERPNEIELVINLKTAKALGLTIPPTLLARTNEVID